MKRVFSALIMLVIVAASLGAGYWWGARQQAPASTASAGAAAGAPSGLQESSVKAVESGKTGTMGSGRILYYRNPMGLADTSPVPKKDAMGMDYVPVYEGEEPHGPELKIALDKVQKLGVITEAAALRNLSLTVRAFGTLDIDERTQSTVTPRFEGWIQRLHVNTTGQAVQRGQPLMEVYSPDLVAAQQEYLVASKGAAALKDASPESQANMRNLIEGSIQRLRIWGIADEELALLRAEGKPRNEMTLRSPASGIVVEKPALQGMRFMPGELLYKISDLSSLWVLADVFEQDLGLIRQGQVAAIRLNAFPDKVFRGTVAFIYPTVNAETRTAKVRIELPNPGQVLKPAMYASVEFLTGHGRRLSIPDSAVLDSGTRQTVLVSRGEGLFEPREVRLGVRGDGYVEVLAGVKAGEKLVVNANFLIDSESNLKAALGAFESPAPVSQASSVPGAVRPGETAAKAHSGH
jgi:Cu(I)/Ag(I) efflux system membrane fusion protein